MLGIETKLSKFANYLGLKQEGERDFDPLQETVNATKKDTGGAKMLANSLLYDFADEKTGIVWSKDSIGCWFEIDQLVGSSDGIEKNLTLFFNDELPEGGVLQFLLIADHDVSRVLDTWESGRKYGGEVIDRLTQYRRNFIENCAVDFKKSRDGRLARNYRTFVCYSQKDSGNISIDQLLKFQTKLANKLKAEHLNPRICDANDLIEIGRNMLQMELGGGKKSKPKYCSANALNGQIVLPFRANIVEEEQILHQESGLASKIFAPVELPESFSLSQMIKLLGDDHRTIPARFVISYSLANNLGASGTSSIKAQGRRIIHAAGKSYTKDDLVVKEEAGQWVQALAVHKKGEIFLSESMQVMITAPQDEIDIASEVLRSLYNSHDWKLGVCNKIQRIASLAMLPMMPICYWKALKFFRLTRTALSGEVVAKLPLQGEWKGVPTSGVLLMGRRGQLINWNPFFRIGGGGNYNVCMMAPPGSGKSFLLLELAQSMIAQDVAVFVMDIGGSYKNLCQAMSAEMVRFNHENKISLNPFAALCNSGAIFAKASDLLRKGETAQEISDITGLSVEEIEALAFGQSGAASEAKELDGIELLTIPAADGSKKRHFVTKDSLIYAKSMVAAMCGAKDQGRAEALIERAIIEGISVHGNELNITKLSYVLENLKCRRGQSVDGAAALADNLFPYTEGGIHGRFFSSGEEASFKSPLTVFELEELVNDEALLAVVLQVVLMQITMQFLCGDRTKRFMLIVDEAWMILDFAGPFLERFARTVRKYGGSLVVCTQDLNSFGNECGTRKSQAAVLECSTWKLILQQKAEGMDTFAKSRAYQKYLGLIASVKKCSSNKYSEVLINTDGATVVGRLATDPYSTAIFSSEDKDFKFLVEQEKLGVVKHEALLALSKKYGTLPDLEERGSKGVV